MTQLVLNARSYTLIRVVRVTGVYQGVLLDDARDARDSDTLSERHEFYVDRDIVSRGIRLERKSESVHDLARPRVLNLESLVELEGVGGVGSLKGKVLDRVEVGSETGSNDGGMEFVRDASVAVIRADGRREVAVEHKVEGERVEAGFQCMRVFLVTL